jgi:hypothetical protein
MQGINHTPVEGLQYQLGWHTRRSSLENPKTTEIFIPSEGLVINEEGNVYRESTPNHDSGVTTMTKVQLDRDFVEGIKKFADVQDEWEEEKARMKTKVRDHFNRQRTIKVEK